MNNMHKMTKSFEINPIIAAVRRESDIEYAIKSPVSVTFLLHGDIFNIKSLVNNMKDNNKEVFIHMDFLEGIGRDSKAIEYIIQEIQPTGIISTRNNHIRYAKEQGIYTIQRFFIIDTQSYETAIRTAQSISPDMVEIMPGIMPSIVRRINRDISLPVIAGGLIDNKKDMIEILNAGAIAVSTAKKELWEL